MNNWLSNTKLLIMFSIVCFSSLVYARVGGITTGQQLVEEKDPLLSSCIQSCAGKTGDDHQDCVDACQYCAAYCTKTNNKQMSCVNDCFKSYVQSYGGQVTTGIGIETIAINLPSYAASAIQGYIFTQAGQSLIPLNQPFTLVNDILKPTNNILIPDESPLLIDIAPDPAKIFTPVFGSALPNKNQTTIIPVCASGMTWQNTITLWTAPDGSSQPGENDPIVIANQVPLATQWLVFNKALFFNNINQFVTLKRAKLYFMPFIWLNLTFDGQEGTVTLNSIKIVAYNFPKYDFNSQLSTVFQNFIENYFSPGVSLAQFNPTTGPKASAEIITITGDQLKKIPNIITNYNPNPSGYVLPTNTGCTQ